MKTKGPDRMFKEEKKMKGSGNDNMVTVLTPAPFLCAFFCVVGDGPKLRRRFFSMYYTIERDKKMFFKQTFAQLGHTWVLSER